MSYCRFSTNAFRSDVYCYKHARGGYRIEVAANRLDIDRESLPDEPEDLHEYIRWYDEELSPKIDEAERRPIGLPRDGDSVHVSTPGEATEELRALREEGYHVPQKAIDQLHEEKNT